MDFTWFYNIWLTSADINAVKSDQRLCSSSNILGSHDLLIYYWRRLRLFAVWHCSTLHSSAPIQNLEGSLWIFDIVVVSLHLGAGVQHTSIDPAPHYFPLLRHFLFAPVVSHHSALPPAHSALACQGLLVFQSFYMWPRTNRKPANVKQFWWSWLNLETREKNETGLP